MRLIFFKKLLSGLAFGAAICATLLLIFALILSKQVDPSKNSNLFALISLVMGSFLGGKIATLGVEKRALQGLTFGVLFSALILLISVFLSSFDASSLLKMLITLVSAFMGAMIGKNANNKRSSSKRMKSVIKRYATR